MFVHRPIVMSEAGMVVSGHHKASEAGAAVLRDGGNAIDAAVAASAVLAVAIPHMNGIGGDCIALYFDAAKGETTAINGSGRAPARCSPSQLRLAGHSRMPRLGPHAISVFGLVAAWQDCLQRFGTRSLGSLLSPAVRLAEVGVPVDLVLQSFLAGRVYADLHAQFPLLGTIYGAPGHRPLGARMTNAALAESLRAIASDGARAMYDGVVGSRLLADLKGVGSLLDADDLVRHVTEFQAPLTVAYAGGHLHAAPPNAQGIALAALASLADMEASDKGRMQPFEPAAYLDAKLCAFEVREAVAGEPEHTARPHPALDREALRQLSRGGRRGVASKARGGGDTSTLVVIDRHGNAVSWVQSLFEEFGSGVVSASTGIVLHNRLALQTLEEERPYALRPGQRPFHTLCPALVERNRACEIAIATPGDHGQPQSIFQVLTRHYAEGYHMQAAIEAPRIRHDDGLEVMVEDRAPASWVSAIRESGYEVAMIGPWSRLAGGVNAIQRTANGLLMGAADPRRASYAIAAD